MKLKLTRIDRAELGHRFAQEVAANRIKRKQVKSQ